MTILITLVALVLGIVLGLIICGMRLSENAVARRFALLYIDFFRNTPEMVLIFWVYFCVPPLFDIRLSAFWSGTIALSLVSGAYMAEIFRAGIESISRGQIEAAYALGLRFYPRWTAIILPQALRRMIPAIVGYFTELLKNTGLLSAIGVTELVYESSTLGAQTFRYLEFFTFTAILYFATIYPISILMRRLEGAAGRMPKAR